jgi:hypothetical protein
VGVGDGVTVRGVEVAVVRVTGGVGVCEGASVLSPPQARKATSTSVRGTIARTGLVLIPEADILILVDTYLVYGERTE